MAHGDLVAELIAAIRPDVVGGVGVEGPGSVAAVDDHVGLGLDDAGAVDDELWVGLTDHDDPRLPEDEPLGPELAVLVLIAVVDEPLVAVSDAVVAVGVLHGLDGEVGRSDDSLVAAGDLGGGLVRRRGVRVSVAKGAVTVSFGDRGDVDPLVLRLQEDEIAPDL